MATDNRRFHFHHSNLEKKGAQQERNWIADLRYALSRCSTWCHGNAFVLLLAFEIGSFSPRANNQGHTIVLDLDRCQFHLPVHRRTNFAAEQKDHFDKFEGFVQSDSNRFEIAYWFHFRSSVIQAEQDANDQQFVEWFWASREPEAEVNPWYYPCICKYSCPLVSVSWLPSAGCQLWFYVLIRHKQVMAYKFQKCNFFLL